MKTTQVPYAGPRVDALEGLEGFDVLLPCGTIGTVMNALEYLPPVYRTCASCVAVWCLGVIVSDA